MEWVSPQYSRSRVDSAGEVLISGSPYDLVSVDSMAALRRAYPNYFLDTKRFVEELERAIG
jgi:hypothetical protein